jgi:ATP/maltotriose-dependent transcriptional regulator MalT
VDAPLLVAVASHTGGSVLVADGEAGRALPMLRAALTTWQQLGAPYESAHERALIGVACRQLGDEEAARLEFDQARTMFEALGAAPDVAAIDALVDATESEKPLPDGLTAREAEVLKLVTAGLSNHDIAVQLVVSDHTVRRHLQNIFAKVGVSSRAAATAYAFEHGLA